MLIRAIAMLLLLISFSAYAQDSSDGQCRLTTLEGADAQEMMVKGVIMHTELEKQEQATHMEYTFVHTVRADWTIWVCIHGVDVRDGQPDNLRLSCTACDY